MKMVNCFKTKWLIHKCTGDSKRTWINMVKKKKIPMTTSFRIFHLFELNDVQLRVMSFNFRVQRDEKKFLRSAFRCPQPFGYYKSVINLCAFMSNIFQSVMTKDVRRITDSLVMPQAFGIVHQLELVSHQLRLI